MEKNPRNITFTISYDYVSTSNEKLYKCPLMIQFSYLHYLLIQIQSYTIKSNNSLPPMIQMRENRKISTLFHINDINFTTLVDEYKIQLCIY